MASSLHQTCAIISLVILSLAPIPGLATKPYTNILEYPEKGSSIDDDLKENRIAADKVVASTKVVIQNKALGALHFYVKKDWSGSVVDSYPHTIQQYGTPGEFLHQGVSSSSPSGSMGAVMYLGPNLRGELDQCVWVLAWSTPSGLGAPNKVYVETGALSKYPMGTIPWDRIKNDLESSLSDSSYVSTDDKCALTKAKARMVPSNGNSPVAFTDFFI